MAPHPNSQKIGTTETAHAKLPIQYGYHVERWEEVENESHMPTSSSFLSFFRSFVNEDLEAVETRLTGSPAHFVGEARSFYERHDLPFNTSVLINPNGKIVTKYRKIHLFDIRLKGKEILESGRNQAGKNPKLAKIENIKAGLSICYDLRFPELYRHYSRAGAKIICIPSSFTRLTGEAHWHTLIKARAIENLSYVIAPNQAGIGSGGIKTYGHSLIVDPWGKILAEGPANGETVIFADIDLEYLKQVRKNLPALEHRKIFCLRNTNDE